MAVFTRLQRWLWVGKDKESINCSPKWGLGSKEMDSVRFPSLVKGSIMGSSRRKGKREEKRIDKEHDAVLVSMDDSESDWSVGWVEPHAPQFQSDDIADNSFAVLVPCYRHDDHQCKELKSKQENLINYLPVEFNDSRKYVEQWLSSLQQ
ncbi:uncharacterized protein LOC124916677 [Impatiens glandulifera]|uniref:uncharacterized protein LOC124916677 n=1 Tax=Impatiens glandulifera TaxID=253017 RepID=UPI001FB17726|nr:uncharacterized protein LOC124916677 [Impatiens glandulifera]